MALKIPTTHMAFVDTGARGTTQFSAVNRPNSAKNIGLTVKLEG